MVRTGPMLVKRAPARGPAELAAPDQRPRVVRRHLIYINIYINIYMIYIHIYMYILSSPRQTSARASCAATWKKGRSKRRSNAGQSARALPARVWSWRALPVACCQVVRTPCVLRQIPVKRWSDKDGQKCGSHLRVKSAGQICGSNLRVKSAGQICGSHLRVKSAGQVCGSRVSTMAWSRMPAKHRNRTGQTPVRQHAAVGTLAKLPMQPVQQPPGQAAGRLRRRRMPRPPSDGSKPV
jgi:hypothetical protein